MSCALSALRIVSMAEPLFDYPLIAEAPEVEISGAPTGRGHQDHDHHRHGHSNDDPASGHE